MKTKNKMWLYLLLLLGLVLILNNCKKTQENTSGSITDKDGNVYTSVTIGTQVWMVQNLKTTKLNDGNPIPDIIDNIAWLSLTTPAYCWYNNDASTYKKDYGALYNWYTVKTGKLCPSGWHVPSNEEWITLRTYLGGEAIAGGKLKESGTSHWQSPNTGATNESGFTALPGGGRRNVGSGNEGKFDGQGIDCSWWSTTRLNSEPFSPIYGFWIQINYSRLFRSEFYVNDGVNVRCIKN
jgi:uncharacterized protein (TIGR02145 family)